jgi:hypothetical protein
LDSRFEILNGRFHRRYAETQKMKRRLQFSLLRGLAAMLVVAAALGVYMRWPYYLAGKALDRAAGDTSFAAWPAVRLALIHDRVFRDSALTDESGFKIAMLHRSTFYLDKRSEQIILSVAGAKREWVVRADEFDGEWSVTRINTAGPIRVTASCFPSVAGSSQSIKPNVIKKPKYKIEE